MGVAAHKRHVSLRTDAVPRLDAGRGHTAALRSLHEDDADLIAARIAEMARTQVNVARLARKFSMPYNEVVRIVREADAREFAAILAAPDAERGRHYRILGLIAEKALRSGEESRQVRDADGRAVLELDRDKFGAPLLDADGNPIMRLATQPMNVRALNVARDAMADQRKIAGLDAPVRVQSESINAHVIINRDANRRMLADPVLIDLTLKAEARLRELEGGSDAAASA